MWACCQLLQLRWLRAQQVIASSLFSDLTILFREYCKANGIYHRADVLTKQDLTLASDLNVQQC